MIRRLYATLWHLAPFLIRRHLRRRALKSPAYLAHWDERFGQAYPNPVQRPIWIHAVSVGETRAAEPLVQALRRHFPDSSFLITQMTPTGRATAQSLFPDAQCRYLPYDKSEWVARFLAEHRPICGILMETEIWPNLMHGCKEAGIPLFLANARLSENPNAATSKSASWSSLPCRPSPAALPKPPPMPNACTSSARPTSTSAATPNTTSRPPDDSRPLAVAFKERIGSRPVVVCASTRMYKGTDEAELLLKAWQGYRGNALLVIVPRHPENFQTAYDTAKSLGYTVQKRSDGQPVSPDTQVWIGDSMGELAAYYLSADIAFVGGSLVDAGCQNIIEPISCHVPTLFGYSNYNFAQACKGAVEAKAAVRVETAEAWYRTTRQYLDDETLRQQLISHTEQFISQHQGASAKIAKAIADCLNQR